MRICSSIASQTKTGPGRRSEAQRGRAAHPPGDCTGCTVPCQPKIVPPGKDAKSWQGNAGTLEDGRPLHLKKLSVIMPATMHFRE